MMSSVASIPCATTYSMILSRYRTGENASSVNDPPSAVHFVKVSGGVIGDSNPLDDKGRVRKGADFLV